MNPSERDFGNKEGPCRPHPEQQNQPEHRSTKQLLNSLLRRERHLQSRIRTLDAEILRLGREMRAARSGSPTEQLYQRRALQCLSQKRALQKRLNLTLSMAASVTDVESTQQETGFVGEPEGSTSDALNANHPTRLSVHTPDEPLTDHRDGSKHVNEMAHVLSCDKFDPEDKKPKQLNDAGLVNPQCNTETSAVSTVIAPQHSERQRRARTDVV